MWPLSICQTRENPQHSYVSVRPGADYYLSPTRSYKRLLGLDWVKEHSSALDKLYLYVSFMLVFTSSVRLICSILHTESRQLAHLLVACSDVPLLSSRKTCSHFGIGLGHVCFLTLVSNHMTHEDRELKCEPLNNNITATGSEYTFGIHLDDMREVFSHDGI